MIGIMQGRLSPMIDGQIQQFPKTFWKAEFFIANALGLSCIEWTLDRNEIEINPFFINNSEIKKIVNMTNISVPSITYDAAMQSPLVLNGIIQTPEVNLLKKVLEKCRELGLSTLVLPLVDNASVSDADYAAYAKLIRDLGQEDLDNNIRIAIESDFPPSKLRKFIEDIGCKWVGINYDIGNSASLGYNFNEEIELLDSFIFNIHVKDRPLGGTTCPFREKNTKFKNKIKFLYEKFPNINLIIQGARSPTGNDVGIAANYLEYVKTAINYDNFDHRKQ